MTNKFKRGDFNINTQKYFWSYINGDKEYWVNSDKFKEYKLTAEENIKKSNKI